jgi:hypothetical protein
MNLLAVSFASALLALLPAGQDPVAVPTAGVSTDAAPVPWAVGERLEYDLKLGIARGSGVMEVRQIEQIRGRPAYHIYFQVRGGIPLFRINDVFESWMDTQSLSSLRFHQDQDEGPKERQRRYEIYPDRQVYTEAVQGRNEEQRTVANPVDDASFLYFVRTVPLEAGRTYQFNNYFRPDRNPVTLRVLRREQVRVPAGTFNAVVVQPTIKTRTGIFGEEGRAEVWLSDDDERIVLQIKSRMTIGTLNLQLKAHRQGGSVGSARR